MMIAAESVRALLRRSPGKTTQDIARALDAPEERVSALLGRLEATCEIYRGQDGRRYLWNYVTTDPLHAWVKLATLRRAGADARTIQQYKTDTFAIRYGRSVTETTDNDEWVCRLEA